jgi:purine-binding chemotaxis protein CheW
MDSRIRSGGGSMKEIIVFELGENHYGVEVNGLQGIENYMQPTTMADAPNHVLGIVNIRKTIYPVLSLASKFGLQETPVTENTKMLILNTNGGPLACIVDDVVQMHVAKDEDVQPVPQMLKTKKTKYAECIIKVEDKLVIVIETNNLFDEKEAEEIAQVKDNI